MRVFKYPLTSGEQEISIPEGAIPLCVHRNQGGAAVWFLVDPDQAAHPQSFFLAATGQEIPQKFSLYLGSTHELEGWMVFHLFATGKVKS